MPNDETSRSRPAVAERSRAVKAVHLTVLHQPFDVRIFHKECTTLSEAGYDVHLLAHDATEGAVDGVHMHAIPRPTWRIRGLRGVQRLRRAYGAAQAVQPTLCHLHDPELIPVGFALKARGVRVLYDAHEDTPSQILAFAGTSLRERAVARARARVFGILEGMAARRFDGCIVATPAIGRRFPSPRSMLVRNFPRTDDFDPPSRGNTLPYDERGNTVVYAGGLATIRGLPQMAGAMELLPRTLEAHLLLLGALAPSNEESRRDLARLARVQGVEVKGWQSREVVARSFEKARIGLLVLHPTPNQLVSLPIKLFEYMAAGLPIVASDFPLWREIIEAERCGVLVDPLDPRSIADGIRYLLENPDEAHAMGERGRRAVEQRYNWVMEATGLLSLYRSVCEPLRTNGA